MPAWLASNGSTVLVALVLLVLVCISVRQFIKNKGKGGCGHCSGGCSHCSGGCGHCAFGNADDEQKE
ncbi:MAG TPA: FeoB-associated Cys-rich membrane protein [Lachnoclostridium sp.]|uniref:Attachment p12 family protein n=1 Tax=[Clostridium] celerecrescens 18A TaxID=1286362 RepID=A0A2M8Z276_9FIRM|nr:MULTISPECIES: FeoB-associated Cys-rich membrane protein [Lacrimispora]PJJ27549.1 attachment p12 family protein [[Clostridium] celerecrescens 18A]HBE86281.1 FeoB-associated Cys-rich membrane protein [Lachnoclostridium sp.]